MAVNASYMFQNAPDLLTKAVIKAWREASPLFEHMPFEDVNSLKAEGYVFDELPSVGFRKLNSGFSESTVAPKIRSWSLFVLGGDIDVDLVFTKTKNAIGDPVAVQREAKTKALAYTFNDWIINGDQTNSTYGPDGPNGLWYLLQKSGHYASSQTLSAGGLDVSATATSLATNQSTLIRYIEDLIDRVDGGADLLIMNRDMRIALNAAARERGLFSTTKDSIGRTVTTWGEGGPLIIDAGYKADQSTYVIGNTEAVDGSALTGGSYTSIYAVKFGPDKFTGLQVGGVDVRDLGELESKPVLRTRIEWITGLAASHPRCIARMVGVQAV